MKHGIVGDIFGWLQHPIYSSGNEMDWLAGFGLLLIVAYLWATFVNRIV
ncbi:MAG: hypothetical protein KGL39_44400 [Patescibacteria group bacterium]|nr:hypothetical protein [Patescibacteria group bacterium]